MEQQGRHFFIESEHFFQWNLVQYSSLLLVLSFSLSSLVTRSVMWTTLRSISFFRALFIHSREIMRTGQWFTLSVVTILNGANSVCPVRELENGRKWASELSNLEKAVVVTLCCYCPANLLHRSLWNHIAHREGTHSHTPRKAPGVLRCFIYLTSWPVSGII